MSNLIDMVWDRYVDLRPHFDDDYISLAEELPNPHFGVFFHLSEYPNVKLYIVQTLTDVWLDNGIKHKTADMIEWTKNRSMDWKNLEKDDIEVFLFENGFTV